VNEIIEKLKKPQVYVPVVLLVLFLGVGTMYAFGRASKDATSPAAKTFSLLKSKVKAEKTATSPIDGLEYPESVAKRHALGVMIENHPDARPQSGLADAAVVYEAMAEGGITRFLAIFSPKLPAEVGPVRSARTYYLDWCLEYDCFYSHVGGNIDALDLIPKIGIKDLDQFKYGVSKYGKTYYRTPKKGIATEHTMFADPAKLYEIAKTNNWPESDSFPKISFKKPVAETERPASQQVKVEISSKSYEVIWDYDAATNSYARTMGGTPHKDGKSGQQIKSTVVIVQEAASKSILTRINEQGLQMDTVGGGKAYIYQDGKEVIGSWKKANQKAQTIFYDASDNEIKYNPGQRWITVVNPGSKVTVTQ
jgi:hypothetical protein